jgi:hypothetical protein
MQGEHHYTDYQQHMNQGIGNVKREETKQPKNNQNCRNCFQHFLTHFFAKRAMISLIGTHYANRDASVDFAFMLTSLPDWEFQTCSI